MARVYISAGSNIKRRENIAAALRRLEAAFGSIQRSPVYESRPVGGSGPNYYNLALAFDTDLPALELRNQLRDIERDLGRTRNQAGLVAIDLDLLLFGELRGDFGDFQLPHPDILRYRHVLQPLVDLAGDMKFPGEDRTLRALLQAHAETHYQLEAVAEL